MQIKKPKLVDDYKDYKKWWSAKLSWLMVAVLFIWGAIPDGVKDWLPVEARPYIAGVIVAIITLATLFKQNIKKNDKQD